MNFESISFDPAMILVVSVFVLSNMTTSIVFACIVYTLQRRARRMFSRTAINSDAQRWLPYQEGLVSTKSKGNLDP
jgi:hypothetical protein